MGATLCAWDDTPSQRFFTRRYPNVNIIRTKAPLEPFELVLNGKCKVALVEMSNWVMYERDVSVNGACKMEWIGRIFKSSMGAFGVSSDAGTRCSSLIRDVVHVHMLAMEEDGFIGQAWETYLRRTGSIDCAAKSQQQSSSEESPRLNIQNTGGIFVMHGGLSVIPILFAIVHRWFGLTKRRDKERKEAEAGRRLLRAEAMKAIGCSKGSSRKTEENDERNGFGFPLHGP